MSQLRWRVKLVVERPSGVVTETDLACIERDEQIDLAELGLRLEKAKRLMQAAILVGFLTTCPVNCG